jgi:putative hydrolase of the HAD superfamily
MIGDCIDADVRGAVEFGIEAIHFNPEKKVVPLTTHSISKLVELKKYL